MRIKVCISQLCYFIIKTSAFEAFIILVILANTIKLAMEDPTTDEQSEEMILVEDIFLYIYTGECLLKIFGLGFVL